MSHDEDDGSIQFGDWLGYNTTESDTTWLPGTGDDFGWFSFESYPTLGIDDESAIVFGNSLHFLNGPVATDMPPRLYDFQVAYQSRKTHTERFMFDYRLGVGVFSDFEDSARKGVRFPGHAVAYYGWDDWFVSVIGAEFLDRDDVSVLPVVGFVMKPTTDLVFEWVFPRPKMQVRLDDNYAMYLSGEMGGGTWAIERQDDSADNATYRDFRAMIGFLDYDDHDSSFEIGWAFGRKLQYRSGVGNYPPDDSLLIRFRSHF